MDQEGLTLFGFGSLHIAGCDEAFAFQPYEISRHSMGLILTRPFFTEALGKSLLLKTPVGNFPLALASVQPMTDGPEGLCRGRFYSAAADVDFEQQLKPVVDEFRQQGHCLQAVRFSVGDPTLAVAKTFGTGFNYPFQIKNISKSGILLTADLIVAAPFQINSLIELQFLSQNELIPHSFDCLAKVVRIENADSQHSIFAPQGYGAKFIDLNGSLEHEIHRLVANLEANHPSYGAA